MAGYNMHHSTPILYFLKLNWTCSLSKSFVILLEIAAISMHSWWEGCAYFSPFQLLFHSYFYHLSKGSTVFSATETLLFRTSFSFLSLSDLESIILSFSLNSLLLFISSGIIPSNLFSYHFYIWDWVSK